LLESRSILIGGEVLSKKPRDFARKNADVAIYKQKSGQIIINEF
jgi:hypothetical protein